MPLSFVRSMLDSGCAAPAAGSVKLPTAKCRKNQASSFDAVVLLVDIAGRICLSIVSCRWNHDRKEHGHTGRVAAQDFEQTFSLASA